MKTNQPDTAAQLLQELVYLILKKGDRVKSKLIDNAELRNVLKVCDRTIYRMRKEHKIPYTKIGKKYYYPRDFFDTAEFTFGNKTDGN